MTNYIFLGKSGGTKFCIEGIDVFNHKWRSLGECDIVFEPETKKPFNFSFYQIESGSKKIVFLAGKFDNGKWGFYKKADENDIIF